MCNLPDGVFGLNCKYSYCILGDNCNISDGVLGVKFARPSEHKLLRINSIKSQVSPTDYSSSATFCRKRNKERKQSNNKQKTRTHTHKHTQNGLNEVGRQELIRGNPSHQHAKLSQQGKFSSGIRNPLHIVGATCRRQAL